MEKHRTFRLNTGKKNIALFHLDFHPIETQTFWQIGQFSDRVIFAEVSLDANRTWCPQAGCDTICHICTGNKSQGVPVTCPSCVKEFCSLCSSAWHPGLTCAENGAALVRAGQGGAMLGSETGLMGDIAMWMAGAEAENIKRCPMCAVPIERDAGCAQMMCKRCKHVFCWYCLASLDVRSWWSWLIKLCFKNWNVTFSGWFSTSPLRLGRMSGKTGPLSSFSHPSQNPGYCHF